MPYNPFKHDRKSIRLKNYDYTQDGLYFITICVQDHKCLFGAVQNDEMFLTEAGIMVEKWWQKLPDKFSAVQLYDYVVMPNHFHGIVVLDAEDCPDVLLPNTIEGNHAGLPLQDVVHWFKTMTTNEYIRNVKSGDWPRFATRLWQRNYFEHIIRSEKSYSQIADYIAGNPSKWQDDKYYKFVRYKP